MKDLKTEMKKKGTEFYIAAEMKRHQTPLYDWSFRHAEARDGCFVLDVNSLDGKSLQAWQQRYPSCKAAGICLNETASVRSRKQNREALRENRCTIRSADPTHLTFMNDMFAWVSVFDSIYFLEEPAKACKELYRVLKPGGHILIADSFVPSNEKDSEAAAAVKNMKLYDAEELQKLLQTAGFEDVKAWRLKKDGWLCLRAAKPTLAEFLARGYY